MSTSAALSFIYYATATALSWATPYPWWLDALGCYVLGLVCVWHDERQTLRRITEAIRQTVNRVGQD